MANANGDSNGAKAVQWIDWIQKAIVLAVLAWLGNTVNGLSDDAADRRVQLAEQSTNLVNVLERMSSLESKFDTRASVIWTVDAEVRHETEMNRRMERMQAEIDAMKTGKN